jgi:hypothetical protein
VETEIERTNATHPRMISELPVSGQPAAAEAAPPAPASPPEPAPAADDAPPKTTPEEDVLLNTLASLWQAHQDHGLSTRHMIGELLNRRYDPPTEKQARGKYIMTLAANRLHISIPDLSRMRWLAFLFKSVEDLKAKHPDVTTWTKFKERLPALKQQAGLAADSVHEQAAPAAAKKQGGAARKVVRSLKRLTDMVKKNEAALGKEERDALAAKLQEFARVVAEKFQIRLTVSRPRKPTEPAAA